MAGCMNGRLAAVSRCLAVASLRQLTRQLPRLLRGDLAGLQLVVNAVLLLRTLVIDARRAMEGRLGLG